MPIREFVNWGTNDEYNFGGSGVNLDLKAGSDEIYLADAQRLEEGTKAVRP